MRGFFTWIRDQRVRVSERFGVPDQEPAQQPGDTPDTDDVEVPPSVRPGPPPLTGRPPTVRDLIRDILYVDEAQNNFRKASLWVVGLLTLAAVLTYVAAMALAALTRAVAPDMVPSMLHLVGSIAGFGGLTGVVWLLRWRARARRQEPLANTPPNDPPLTDPAPANAVTADPATATGQRDSGPHGSGTGEPQP